MPDQDSSHSNDPQSPGAPQQQPASTSTRTVKEPRGQPNPLYGCAILLIAITTFGFIVTWTIYSGLKQSSEIGTFTSADAPALAPLKIEAAEMARVKTKLDAFATVAGNGKPVTLTLTPDDLNAILVLAGEAGVADYRDMVRFTGIDPGAQLLQADIRWKMNNLPFVNAPDRYLAGHATFKPVIENGALELHIEALEVPGKTVSEGFLRQLRNWPWLNLAKLKDEVKTPLSKVTRFEFTPDGSLFILHCGESGAH
jgi:hypothetical protein